MSVKTKNIKWLSVPNYPVRPGKRAKKLFFDVSSLSQEEMKSAGKLIYKTMAKEFGINKKNGKGD